MEINYHSLVREANGQRLSLPKRWFSWEGQKVAKPNPPDPLRRRGSFNGPLFPEVPVPGMKLKE